MQISCSGFMSWDFFFLASSHNLWNISVALNFLTAQTWAWVKEYVNKWDKKDMKSTKDQFAECLHTCLHVKTIQYSNKHAYWRSNGKHWHNLSQKYCSLEVKVCVKTGRADQKIKVKNICLHDEFSLEKNKCLQQKVSAGWSLAIGNRGGANLSVIHLRCERSSLEGKPSVNIYKYIFVQL